MKSIKTSQGQNLFCGFHTVLEGTDGQCLAALHTHISALEPVQHNSSFSTRCRDGYETKGVFIPKINLKRVFVPEFKEWRQEMCNQTNVNQRSKFIVISIVRCSLQKYRKSFLVLFHESYKQKELNSI